MSASLMITTSFLGDSPLHTEVQMKNKEELATFLGATHTCFNPKLDKYHFLYMLKRYEEFEGKTPLKD